MNEKTDVIEHSRLYTFIDNDKQFALYFLEGQRLIHDLVVTQTPKPAEFAYFRPMILSVQPMLGFLKKGELFCFYIDSETPYFRLKIEMNALGLMRGILLSDALDAVPDTATGRLRLLKFLPSSEMPYQSIIGLDAIGMDEIINLVLSRSYQVNSRIFISAESDQSFMLNQLPLMEKEEPSNLEESFRRYAGPLNEVMKKGLTDRETIVEAIQQCGFKYLADKPVRFTCGCSKEQMVNNLRKLANAGEEDLFLPGQDALEVVCEYCKAAYRITRRELRNAPSDYQ